VHEWHVNEEGLPDGAVLGDLIATPTYLPFGRGDGLIAALEAAKLNQDVENERAEGFTLSGPVNTEER
jgi:hypothetical protein